MTGRQDHDAAVTGRQDHDDLTMRNYAAGVTSYGEGRYVKRRGTDGVSNVDIKLQLQLQD